jgi:hypothetical protein
MRTAVMQPYLFPYIGYFQLVKAVDTFIFFDDVNFITRGFIHRNSVATNGKNHLFTVPLSGASQNLQINQVEIHEGQYDKWWKKFQGTLKMNYAKAPFYNETTELVKDVFDEPPVLISSLADKSVRAISEYLGLAAGFGYSSDVDYNKEGEAQDKVLEICREYKTDTYINPIGGADLYTSTKFEAQGIKLKLLKSEETPYKQKSDVFLPSLSIIDVLMYNSKAQVGHFLDKYELVKKEQV